MPIIVPYNADSVAPAQVVTVSGHDGARIAYRLPMAELHAGQPLRLNSGGIEFGDPPPLRDMPDVPSQLAFLNRHFQHQCGVWSKYARRFVDRYFAFVEDEIARHREELAARLAPFGSLYEIGHWAFSALRPLPRAHLPAGGALSGSGEAAPELVRVEIAFWTAAGAVAIDLVGRGTRGAAEARWRDCLEAAGIRIVQISHDAIDSDDADAFADRLPDDFKRYWRDEILPAGPFRTDPAPMAEPERKRDQSVISSA